MEITELTIYVFTLNPITLPSDKTLTAENCVALTAKNGSLDDAIQYAQEALKGFSNYLFQDAGLPVVEEITIPSNWKPEPAYIVCQDHPAPNNPTELFRFRFSDHGVKCYQKALNAYARIIAFPGNRFNTFFVCDETFKKVVETPQTKAAGNPPMLVTTYEMV